MAPLNQSTAKLIPTNPSPAFDRFRQELRGEVYTDVLSLGLYATDASMYQIPPLMVVVPRDRADALRAVRLCGELGLPVLARGGGTSLTGQSVGEAVILDVSKHLNHLLELNLEEGWVRVEPGLVCSELNALLRPHAVQFAPDPATANRANIGGMIANNAAGMRSIRYGMTIDHVLALDMALATGEVLNLDPLDAGQLAAKCALPDREGVIYRGLRDLMIRHADEIRARYPKVIRRSGGYALDALLDADPWNLTKLICGSEGTLGVILEAKLRLTPLPRHSALCLAHFDSLDTSLRAAALIVAEGPSAVELIDGVILRQARAHPLTRDVCAQIKSDPGAVLVIEVQGDDSGAVMTHIHRIADGLSGSAYAAPVMTEPQAVQQVWQLRSSALGLMTTVPGTKKPVPYIEDAAVPPEVLADYVAEVLAVCRKYNQPVSMFGHVSVGLIHIRPLHDLHQSADIARMAQIQEEVFPLVQKYGGSWSGEHGDGIVRGGYNRRFFGDALYGAFQEVKQFFDQEGRMNPGKVIDTPPLDSHLRFGPGYQPLTVQSGFHYRAQGGMLAAAEQCTGVGACRKTQVGVMCPSYAATRDEVHSTRGRANALRLALTGQLGPEALGSNELKAVMDLCVGCKGCKGECPNSVDMARLKSDVLYQHQMRHGVPLRARLFGHLSGIARLASGPQAPLVNALMGSAPMRGLMERILGIDSKRTLPPYTSQRLSRWFVQRPSGGIATEQGRVRDTVIHMRSHRVVLFNDTYTEHYLPQVGRAAIEVLEAAGYQVELATLGDSQRSVISQGLLDQAKRDGTRLFQRLDALLADGVPLLVCEPSCATALADDLPDLLDDTALAHRVASRVQMLDRFLEQELAADRCTLPWKVPETAAPRRFLVHGHCHQKTLDGGRWTHRLLARIPGAIVVDTEAGCCGMAGAFGYEAEHAELSRIIFGQRLLPRLVESSTGTRVVTNGFSCRHQIADLSERQPGHVMEIIRDFL
ncbi:MAG: FAD-linked oxidase C-terminal domain-containing protein [Gammaproteobacteria bacterium]|nr:FAD-linked oxidase C-terminal domain-containing protein [Gammaproteobacteria bacterium]